MNDKRRKSVRVALTLLDRVNAIVDRVCDEEQDAADNYPENLQSTDTYEKMEQAVDSMNEAMDKIDEVKDLLEDVL